MTQVQPEEQPEQPCFSPADRDRIRRVLLRYMEDNGFRVPTLQKMIATANNISLDHLPLSTLQRFIKDSHRSNELFVRFCNRFVASLPEDDPLAALGEAVAAFMAVRADAADSSDSRPSLDELAGTFEGRAAPAGTDTDSGSDNLGHWVPYSQLTIIVPPARPYAVIQETVTNWNRRDAGNETTPARRAYEGVLFRSVGAYCALMRNILTGTIRLYWLGRRLGKTSLIHGYGHESIAPFETEPESPLHLSNVVFVPVRTEPSP